MTKKLPFFKFYPSDWRSDPCLRLCSLEARGFLIELLCIMWQSGGYLTLNSRAIGVSEVSKMVDIHPKTGERLMRELLLTGVLSTDESGFIYSKRMAKDFSYTSQQQEFGKKGGNPNIVNTLKGSLNADSQNTLKIDTRSQILDARCQNIDKEKNNKKESPSLYSLDEIPFQTDSFKSAWNDWIEYRKEIKKPLKSKQSIKALFERFKSMGETDAIASIRQSIANGWQGIFEPRNGMVKQEEPSSMSNDKYADCKTWKEASDKAKAEDAYWRGLEEEQKANGTYKSDLEIAWEMSSKKRPKP